MSTVSDAVTAIATHERRRQEATDSRERAREQRAQYDAVRRSLEYDADDGDQGAASALAKNIAATSALDSEIARLDRIIQEAVHRLDVARRARQAEIRDAGKDIILRLDQEIRTLAGDGDPLNLELAVLQMQRATIAGFIVDTTDDPDERSYFRRAWAPATSEALPVFQVLNRISGAGFPVRLSRQVLDC